MKNIYLLTPLKFNYYQKFILLLTILFVVISCTPPTIEEQVEKMYESKSSVERKEIAIDLAKTENIKVIGLINKHYSDNLVLTEQANLDLLFGYSQLLNYNDFDNKSNVIKCLKALTEPESIKSINTLKINNIIYGLSIKGNKDFENCLIISAKKHGYDAMKSIIETWHSGNNSNGLLNSIISFDEEAIIFLCAQLGGKIKSEDLLARIGEPAVNQLKYMMQDSEQSVRFAAADALVKMITYHPDAVKNLTNAINDESLNIISNNYPFYIRLGLIDTEEILLKALDYNFSEKMGVDFLNCGNSKIESGTKKIAYNHGYNIIAGFGGHNGPKWGSEEVDD